MKNLIILILIFYILDSKRIKGGYKPKKKPINPPNNTVVQQEVNYV